MFNSKGITPPCFPRKPDKTLDTKVQKLGQIGIDMIKSVNITLKEAEDDRHREALAKINAEREFGGHY